MIRDTAGIGVMLTHPPTGIRHQETVQDVGGFRHGGRNGLHGEGGKLVGEMAVGLEPRLASVTGVDQIDGLAGAAGREELPSEEAV